MLSVRHLTKEDISAVHKLELLCFSEPWSEKSLELLLSGDNFGVVCELDGQVVAYGGATCVLDEGAVTNIAVAPEYRRQGIGRAVVRAMLAEAEKKHVSSVFLEVRVSNEAARRLYLSEGFSECGVRKGFYKHPAEDALQMVYNFKNVDKG